MSGGNLHDGTVVSCDDMTPIPVISYNPTNNALVFKDPVQTNDGIASSETETSAFNSPALQQAPCR